MNKLVLLGAPGAGKGSAAEMLKKRLSLAHISMGDLLRQELKEESELGLEAKSYMNSGQLVPDRLILSMIGGRLREEDCRNGYILDGFPRNLLQAEALDTLLAQSRQALDAVILLQVPEEVIIERLSGRRVCGSCGKIYNLAKQMPEREDICDQCNSPLIHREDDQPATISARLRTYREQTEPLIAYYEGKSILLSVDNSGSTEATMAQLEKQLHLA